ncbi:MAG: carboxylating nicotinate-nucleotide diphosphorylase [Bacteroidia bacterium]|nr:carboxylating nicotinate-nucleotide diphosphorylase [Bacteroidia bacterium]
MIDFLNHPETDRIIQEALKEDIGPGDFTSLSTIPEGLTSKARCLIKGDGILAGVDVAGKVIEAVDQKLKMEKLLEDGSRVSFGDIAFYVEGDPRSILQAERLLLNIMQRMSGIASMTRKVVDLLEGTSCRVLDTRKTTPLIRHLEKWAVKIGGGTNHRFGLYDMVMIKDNHVDYAGGIANAIRACKFYLSQNDLKLKIEVETRNLDEVRQVLAEGGVDRIMLDNYKHDDMRKAVQLIDGRAETEASGGITLETVRGFAETGVDFVSMGALTHSISSLDISLKAMK